MSEKVESPEHAQTWSAQLPVLARRPHGATGRPGRSLRRSIRTGGPNEWQQQRQQEWQQQRQIATAATTATTTVATSTSHASSQLRLHHPGWAVAASFCKGSLSLTVTTAERLRPQNCDSSWSCKLYREDIYCQESAVNTACRAVAAKKVLPPANRKRKTS